MFHITSSGRVEPCRANIRACPLAPLEEHFTSAGGAAKALALETIERQVDFQLRDVPAGWGSSVAPWLDTEDDYASAMGELLPTEHRPTFSPPLKKAPANDLSVDSFRAFAASEAAKKSPAVREDWREDIARKATINGDRWADEHPDTSVTFGGYYDSTPDDDEDDWQLVEED